MKKNAFTLVELLVVIVIVSILASLLLPVLSVAKSKGKAIKCLNNLRQIELAMNLYVHDTGFFPVLATSPDNIYPIGKKWYEDVRGYTSSAWTNGINICPTYDGPMFDGAWEGRSHFYISFGSYAYNVGSADALGRYKYGLGGSFEDNALYSGNVVKESQVLNPSDMIVSGDSFCKFPNSNVILEWFEILSRQIHNDSQFTNLVQFQKGPKLRHSGKISVSFFDGHVESIKYEKLFLSKQIQDLRRWHSDNQPHLEIIR